MIRLVALDLDGTLLTSHNEVSPASRTAIADAVARGIHVTAGGGKGKALAHLADLLGVLLSETMAVGDYENDLSMLDIVRTAGGVAVAMANAVPLVMAAATAFVASNDADGVAEAFSRFVEAESAA